MANRLTYFLSILFLFYSVEMVHLQAQVTLEKQGEEWKILVDGKPFEIKGATFGYDRYTENYDTYFKELHYLGVNTIRTWATGENTQLLLDAADKHGIKIMMGIWMRHGRPGMEDDDSFNYLNDEEGKQDMYENAINTVKQFKDHPAVLTWGIGNEVYLNTATDEEKEAYSKFLEKVCSEIKTIDKNHPITSVEAWTFGLDWWEKHVPSLDIYGLNSYGAGAGFLAEELKKRNIDKPYIITEFGVTGEWDIKEETNGIKKEPTDKQKYEAIAEGYKNWISNKSACLGVYVFHYASGDKFIAPWLFTHFKGKKRPQYWAIREAYTGNKPENKVPEINAFSIPDEKKNSGTWIPVKLDVSDPENEELHFEFYYNQRTGSRKRRDQMLPLTFRGDYSKGFEIQLPKVDGAIKVYAVVNDSYGNAGIASGTTLVSDEEASKRKFLVPKVSLPFYVYQDGNDLPYAPSGYMGNYKKLSVDAKSTEDVHSGKTSIKITYDAIEGWYGVAFMDPANDWGDILGGYDITGAKTFSFWAKSSESNVEATVGFGLIDKDKPFPDSSKESLKIVIGKKWKKYTIKLKKTDLSCIRTGFALFSSTDGFAHDIYIDDIVFE